MTSHVTGEHSGLDFVNDPRLDETERQEFVMYIRMFGPDVVIRQHIPTRGDVAVVTEIMTAECAAERPLPE